MLKSTSINGSNGSHHEAFPTKKDSTSMGNYAVFFKPETKESLCTLSVEMVEKWKTTALSWLVVRLTESPEQVQQLLAHPEIAARFLRNEDTKLWLSALASVGTGYYPAIINSGIADGDHKLKATLLASEQYDRRAKWYGPSTAL